MGVVRMAGVDHSYGSIRVLRQVDLDIPVGVTALLGPNGAGKSTLLGLLSSALRLRSGSVEIDGLTPSRDQRRYRESIGFLPQRFSAPNHLTVAEFVELSAWWRRVPRKTRKARVARALAETGLTDRATGKIGKLSGGMLRRLGIAQAVVNEPTVLLLDEPTVGLDPRQRQALRGMIREIGRSRTVLISTHLTEDVVAVADRVAVLDEGTVVYEGSLAGLTAVERPAAPDVDQAYSELLGEGEPA